MKGIYRISSLLLVLCFLMICFVGCGPSGVASDNESSPSDTYSEAQNEDTQSDDTDTTSISNNTESTDSDSSEKNQKPASQAASSKNNTQNNNTENFISDTSNPKIVKNKITIKMFAPKSPMQGSWEDMVLFKEMEKRTNIHVEFEEVPLASYAEKRSLKWEDKKNPVDAFFLANNMDEVVLYSQRGALTPLNDLIDKYAPNYKKWLQKYPDIKKTTTLSDGKMYSFCSVNTQGGSFAKQYINQAWLTKLGLSMPKTIDDYYNVLKQFKEKNPNGKNGKDEIPLSYIGSDQTKNFIMSAFGYVGTGIELDKKTDKITWVPATNNYREYLKFMNKIYKEGLLDPYVFSNQNTDLVVKGKSYQLGSFSTAGAFLIVGDKYDSEYTSIPPLTSSVNNEKMWYQFSGQFDPTTLIIPKTTKYAREIVRWIDAFYDEATSSLQSHGVEGKNWKWDNDKKDTWTFLVPNGLEREQYRATITYQAGLGGAILSTDFQDKDSSPSAMKIAKEAAVYRPYLRSNLPILQYKKIEMQQIADIEAQINSYLSTAEANFIKGIKDPNNQKHWDDHISAMKKIGYERLVTIYQGAYNRYK